MSGASAGSSPLTRGKLRAQDRSAHHLGLIPAHAGKTSVTADTTAGMWAHPRSRGENHGEHFGGGLVQGSSPLTRGKLKASPRRLGANGLIPAHAGKTTLWTATRSPVRAHPRSRGENLERRHSHKSCGGSSPLTRGKPCRRRVSRPVGGLIPAHAGKT